MSGTLPPVAGVENCTSMGGLPSDIWYQFGWLILLLLGLAVLAWGISLVFDRSWGRSP